MVRLRVAGVCPAALAVAMVLMHCQAALAIDEASLGIRTFTAQGQQIGGVTVVITYLSGQYPVDPLVIVTEPIGLVWRAVPPNVYSIVALDDGSEPIPESELITNAPAGAHDIIVNVILPPECPSDVDGDGAVGVTDLLSLLADWGTPEGDINGDGTTNVMDLLSLLADWGDCGAD